MQTIDIKVELMRKGRSMRVIARDLGVTVNAVSLVVKHQLVSRRIMKAIAGILDLDVLTVFPELEGNRGRGRHHRTCKAS